MGLLSDILAVKSPVHFVGCLVGAICLSLITSVHGTDHTVFLTLLLSTFYVFENGATIVIAIIQCEIGKNQLLNNKRKAVATISGICDGLAGFGSILGQFLVGPAEAWRGLPGVFAMFSIGAFIVMLVTVFTTGPIAMWSLILVGLFHSIMFPTIFTLGIKGLGREERGARRAEDDDAAGA